MNRELAIQVANAVLYEGYMLYPYRPSAIKNRQRWTFGILYPPAYPEVSRGTERSALHSECLLKLNGRARVHSQARFLHLVSWQIAPAAKGRFESVPSLRVDGRLIKSRDEGVECSVEFEFALDGDPKRHFEFNFPGSSTTEPLCDSAGRIVGTLSREKRELNANVSVCWRRIHNEVLKLAIDISNTTALPAGALDRSLALPRSLLSAHAILTVKEGEFVSLLEPPEELRPLASECKNTGNFPVLVGVEGERDMLLCSPIVLYDYPQIAPESAGDFFDATEMDEMLTLRVMTLTDREKDEMRLADDHVRALLQRTEESARLQLMRTHGTIRGLRRVTEKS